MYTKSSNPDLSVKGTLPMDVAPPPPPVWSTQGRGFSSVAAGYTGIVCGIQGPDLYIRLGVTHDNPLGISWNKMFCKASHVAVGSSFIVRRTELGSSFVVDMSAVDLTKPKSLLILNWCVIPQCPPELWGRNEESDSVETFISLDKNDNVFLIDSAGNVCMYSGIGSSQGGWSRVSAPPSGERGRGMLSWLAFWREDEPQCDFSNVSSGKQCVWCVDCSSKKLWQLVLSYFESQTALRTNWTKIDFPLHSENEVVCFCADKCESAGILCAVKMIDEAVVLKYFSLNSKNEETKSIELAPPCSLSTYASISICRTSVMSTPSRPSSNQNRVRVKATPTTLATPTLPATPTSRGKESTDVCCENGDCDYCQQVASQPSVSVMLEDSQLSRMLSSAVGRKRGVANSDETRPPKRPRVMPATYSLLEGIDVTADEVN